MNSHQRPFEVGGRPRKDHGVKETKQAEKKQTNNHNRKTTLQDQSKSETEKRTPALISCQQNLLRLLVHLQQVGNDAGQSGYSGVSTFPAFFFWFLELVFWPAPL